MTSVNGRDVKVSVRQSSLEKKGEEQNGQRGTDSQAEDQVDETATRVPSDVEAGKQSDSKERSRENNGCQTRSDEQDILVEFDTKNGNIDPDNPLTWSSTRKWIVLGVISLSSCCVTCTSSVVTTAYDGIEREFGISHEVAILGLSLFVAGLGLGPLLLAPFSEFYGRKPIYIGSLLAFFLLGFPVAFANNAAVFFIFRFLTGLVGSAFLSVAGGTISDMWEVRDAFFPMSVYTMSPFLGPSLGPVFSGFIEQYANWRWTFRVILIWSFVQLLLNIFLTPETFKPKCLIIKARRLRRQTGNPRYYAQHERDLKSRSLSKTVAVSGSRVFLLLALEPMLFLLCLWCAILLGILYLFFELFPIVFAKHNFNMWQDGLSFAGIGLGLILGCVIMPIFTRRYQRIAEKNGGEAPPEARLDAAKVGSILCPVSLFIFAFTSYGHVHWIAPIIGSIPFGTGAQLIFTSVFTFTTDNWRPVAASGMGANSVMRSSFAAGFPLFATQMANRLSTTGAAALLAGLNVLIIPLPFVFAHYGPQLRAKSRYAVVKD